jgi:hypothetical protein
MIVEPKSVIPAFDHLIGKGWTFADLMVFNVFRFGKGMLNWLLGPLLLLDPCGHFTFYLYISG